MDGCIELVGSEPNTTYFMKDSKIVAKRVITVEYGKTVERWYNNDGVLHRDGDLPAVIWYYENREKSCESWYKDDKLHRDGDKPTVVNYPKKQEPIVSAAPSVEERLAKLEATMAKLSALFTEKQ